MDSLVSHPTCGPFGQKERKGQLVMDGQCISKQKNRVGQVMERT